ncbi:MAG: DMT family transporter [Kiloniellales bacterium]|nr:DMT family transporter [Kiloniellales bacterium]
MTSASGVIEARPVLGAAAMLANTVFVPIIGVAVKALTAQGVGTLEMLAGRAWLTFLLLLPLLCFAKNRRAILSADFRAHAVHAAFTIATMACFYFALRTLPIVTVTAINFTTPIFTLILARVLYRDRVAPLGWAALLAGFVGAMIVLRPGAAGFGLDSLVVVLGSILAAGMNLAVRRMPAHSTNYAVVFYFSLAGALVYGAAGASHMTVPEPDEWVWFVTLAVTAIAVHTCVAVAYRMASSVLVGALDYARILWAALIGYFVLSEVPDLIDALGIAMIVVSGLVVLGLSTRAAPPNGTT